MDDLLGKPQKTSHWDGVRNYQARNMLRDNIQIGDQAFFYYSNCNPPGIAGIVDIVKAGYPDFTAFDPESEHYDPKSQRDNPRWYMVDVRFNKKFSRIITLESLKLHPVLSSMQVARRGNRLSITPVTEQEWNIILSLA